MKLYGYEQGSEADKPMRLEEVTITANAKTLRKLAKFLLHMAERVGAVRDRFDHEHFEYFDRSVPKQPRIVVTEFRRNQSGAGRRRR